MMSDRVQEIKNETGHVTAKSRPFFAEVLDFPTSLQLNRSERKGFLDPPDPRTNLCESFLHADVCIRTPLPLFDIFMHPATNNCCKNLAHIFSQATSSEANGL